MQSIAKTLGLILSMEGAAPGCREAGASGIRDAGLRIIGRPITGRAGPTPAVTTWSAGCSRLGRPAAGDGARRHAPDVDASFRRLLYECASSLRRPSLASHHNCRALVDDSTTMSDDQIKRLSQRGAVRYALDTWMMVPGCGERPRQRRRRQGATLAKDRRITFRVMSANRAGNSRHGRHKAPTGRGSLDASSRRLEPGYIADLQKLQECAGETRL